MKVTMIGSGKLGFPVGCAIANVGHNVTFYDTNTNLLDGYSKGYWPMEEAGLQEVYDRCHDRLRFEPKLEDALNDADVVFVAVQTPHAPEQDGSTRFKHVRANFDLSFVKQALAGIATYRRNGPLVIISTMLPGSMRDEIAPLVSLNMQERLIYSPSFIAMGTVIEDFTHPEFWLIGSDKFSVGVGLLKELYLSIAEVPILCMSWESAEMAKVLYNTHITMKITLANLAAALAEKIPYADAFDATNALAHATTRLVSTRYMRPGMVDGGGCHPRDNIALSWLSDHLGLPYNLFDTMMTIREHQVEYLAKVVMKALSRYGLKEVVILGRSFKVGTKLTAGSPSVLLKEILAECGVYTKFDCDSLIGGVPRVYVVGTYDSAWVDYPYAPGSVIIDPWGIVGEIPQCHIHTVGASCELV